MKSISAAAAGADFNALLDAAQKEEILIVRHGKPSVQMIGIEDLYDEEDLQLMRSKEFWQMIAESRRDTSPGLSLDEMKRRLGLNKPAKKTPPRKGKTSEKLPRAERASALAKLRRSSACLER